MEGQGEVGIIHESSIHGGSDNFFAAPRIGLNGG